MEVYIISVNNINTIYQLDGLKEVRPYRFAIFSFYSIDFPCQSVIIPMATKISHSQPLRGTNTMSSFNNNVQCEEMTCGICGTNHSDPSDEMNCFGVQCGDIDSDFGYDVYAGGSEVDDRDHEYPYADLYDME